MNEAQERLLNDLAAQLNGFQQAQMKTNAELRDANSALGKALAREETSRIQSLLLLRADLLKSLSDTAIALKKDIASPQVKQPTSVEEKTWLQKLLRQ